MLFKEYANQKNQELQCQLDCKETINQESIKNEYSIIELWELGNTDTNKVLEQQNQELQRQVEEKDRKIDHLVGTLKACLKYYVGKNAELKDDIAILEMCNKDMEESYDVIVNDLKEEISILKSQYTQLKDAADEVEDNLKSVYNGRINNDNIYKALKKYKQLTQKQNG